MRFAKLTKLDIKLEVKTFNIQLRSKTFVSSDIKNIVNASHRLIYNFFSVQGPDKEGYASVSFASNIKIFRLKQDTYCKVNTIPSC